MYVEKIKSILGDCDISIVERTKYYSEHQFSMSVVIVQITGTDGYDRELLIHDIKSKDGRVFRGYMEGREILDVNVDDLLERMFKGDN